MVHFCCGAGLRPRRSCKADARTDRQRAYLNAEGFDDVKVTGLGGSVSVVTSMEHPFAQRVLSISERFAGKPISVAPLVGGTLPLLGALQRYGGVPGVMAPGNPVY